MHRMVKILLLLPWLLICLVLPAWSLGVGAPMPEFALRTFAGSEISSNDLRGKPVLLIFWNTWCANCLRELPTIDRLAQKFVPQGLQVLAVNSGFNDSEVKARAYWQERAYSFPTGYDHRFEIGQAFGLRGVPTLFLIDSQGIVRYTQATAPPDMDDFFRRLVPATR